MKKATKLGPTPNPPKAARRPRRVGVAEAKARLSEVIRSLADGPVIIHSRGRDVGALVDIDAYERFVADAEGQGRPGGPAFLDALEALKLRHGGGVEGFDPARAKIVPHEPFRPRRRS
jgi:prevent-host-death family protein